MNSSESQSFDYNATCEEFNALGRTPFPCPEDHLKPFPTYKKLGEECQKTYLWLFREELNLTELELGKFFFRMGYYDLALFVVRGVEHERLPIELQRERGDFIHYCKQRIRLLISE